MSKVFGVEVRHSVAFGVFGSVEAAEAFLKVMPAAPEGFRFEVVVESKTEGGEVISVSAIEAKAELRERHARAAYYGNGAF